MPLHAQILCIGGNILFALIFLIGAGTAWGEGNSGMLATMTVFGIAASYSVWVLLKFRRYLSAEGQLERELHIEQLREEIDRLKANNVD
jgi:hypothetical protein